MLIGAPAEEKRENEVEAIFEGMAENFSQNDFTEFSSDLSIHKFKIPSESQDKNKSIYQDKSQKTKRKILK